MIDEVANMQNKATTNKKKFTRNLHLYQALNWCNHKQTLHTRHQSNSLIHNKSIKELNIYNPICISLYFNLILRICLYVNFTWLINAKCATTQNYCDAVWLYKFVFIIVFVVVVKCMKKKTSSRRFDWHFGLIATIWA